MLSRLLLTTLPLVGSIAGGTTVDGAYRSFKQQYESKYTDPEREAAVNALMEREGYMFRFMGERRYEDLKHEERKKNQQQASSADKQPSNRVE